MRSPRRISAYTVGREIPSNSATSLIERSRERTSSAGVMLCEVMATSEALRKAETTSPDRSGESRYEVAKAYFVATHEMLANFGEGAVLPLTSRRKVWEVLEQMRYALSVGPLEAKHAQIEAAAG